MSQWGPSTLILVGFFGMFIGWVPSPITATQTALEKFVEQQTKVNEALLKGTADTLAQEREASAATQTHALALTAYVTHAAEAEHTAQQDREVQIRLLRSVCRNTAKSDVQREACDR